jgi:hypothetical protein
MEININSIFSLIIPLGGLLIAVGIFKQRVSVLEKRVESINDKYNVLLNKEFVTKKDLDAFERRFTMSTEQAVKLAVLETFYAKKDEAKGG